MRLYRVYIEKQALTRQQVRQGELAYSRTVRADSRSAALNKCLRDIVTKVVPEADTTIKYISVHVGVKGSVTETANRLDPMQLVRDTGMPR